MTFTVAEKLAEIEDVIMAQKGIGIFDPENARYHVAILSAIAKDLRARLDGAPAETEVALQRRVDSVMRSKTALGYGNGALVGLAQEVIGRWPAVKQGLELLGKLEDA